MNIDKGRIEKLLKKADAIVSNQKLFTPSLYISDLGRVLYFAYRYKQCNNEEYLKEAKSLLEIVVDNSGDHVLDASLSNGLTGFCWLFKHLISMGILSSNELDSIEHVLPYIEQSLYQDYKNGNYDYIHGAMGKIACLTAYKSKHENVSKANIFDFFKQLVQEDQHGYCWSDSDKKDLINLGYAHGMPSIIVFLIIYLYKEDKECPEIIEKAIDWMITQKNNSGISSFPHNSDQKNSDSRLAWCYGDLGIAYMFLIAAEAYNNNYWHKIGVEIIEKASERNLENSGVNYIEEGKFFDTGFCHGTAGITYLFFKLYKKTKNDNAKRACNYWLNESIINLEKHLLCFNQLPKQDFAEENSEDEILYPYLGLLEGIMGSALVLNTFLGEDLDGWNDLFLLKN